MEHYRVEILPDPPTPADIYKAVWNFFLELVQTVGLSILLYLAIDSVSARIRVESISMQPTLYEGDMVIVNKLAYRWGEPKRGDIIIFEYPPDPKQEPYIKRVIGLPGERVRIADGKVYVNDVLQTEPYLKVTTMRGGEWTVPEGALFVLGDNRNNSSDSRAWGMVPLENVIGKALVIYWPPRDWAVLNMPSAAAAAEAP